MKRTLLAALSALLLAAPAQAEIAVVYDALWENEASTYYGQPQMQSRMVQAAIDVLNSTGACYTLWPIQATKTSLIADGIVQTGVGIGKAYQYDGVLWLGWNGRASNGASPLPNKSGFTGCYPCSLTLTGNGNYSIPTVPQLLTFGATNGTSLAGAGSIWQSSTAGLRCSTGVSFNGGQSANGFGAAALSGYEDHPWLAASNQGVTDGGLSFRASTAVPRGGFRPLIKISPSAIYNEAVASTIMGADYQHAANRADSLLTGAGDDTLAAWMIPDPGNGAPLIFANIMGAGPCYDSLNANLLEIPIPCEFDAPTFLMALAALDSATGGAVWCDGEKVPLRAALTIDGAFRRGARNTFGGVADEDSSVLIASIDSLAALGVPVTVGVNVDSIASYPNEVAWWSRISQLRVAPQAWDGVLDTATAGLAATSALRPVDVFGRFRTRKYYGPVETSAADTSLYANLIYQRTLAASAFGTARLSRLLMAPLDDYSPKNLLWSPTGWDSLFYAISQAGYDRVRTDVHTRSASIETMGGVNRDLMRGGVYQQSRRKSALNGRTIDFLGQTGHNISGSKYQADTTGFAIDNPTFGSYRVTPTIPQMAIGRFWHGFVHDTFGDHDWFPSDGVSSMQYANAGGPTHSYEELFVPFHRAHILKMHVSDFSGLPNGPPARPGWWAVKSIHNQFLAINRLAGRTILKFDYPEAVTP